MGRGQSSLALEKRGSGLIPKLKYFFAPVWNENWGDVCETSQGSSSISFLKSAQVKGHMLFNLSGFLMP